METHGIFECEEDELRRRVDGQAAGRCPAHTQAIRQLADVPVHRQVGQIDNRWQIAYDAQSKFIRRQSPTENTATIFFFKGRRRINWLNFKPKTFNRLDKFQKSEIIFFFLKNEQITGIDTLVNDYENKCRCNIPPDSGAFVTYGSHCWAMARP